MEGIFYIHNILLENQKYLIHCSPNKNTDVIFKECSYLYSFARKNTPVKIIYTEEVIEFSNIDVNVKFYMHLYGISNVRGGTFHQEELPDYMVKTLEEEIKTMTTRVYEQICVANEMTSEFDTRNSDNYTVEFFENKQRLVKTKLSRYNAIMENKKTYNRTIYLPKIKCGWDYDSQSESDNESENEKERPERIEITKEILDELYWFIDFVYGKETILMNNDTTIRVIRFLSIFTRILNMFVNMIAVKKSLTSRTFEEVLMTEIDEELCNGIRFPIEYFKPYIYDRANIVFENEDINTLHFILIKMEYIIQYVLNRMDETDYDISCYPKNMTDLCDSLLYHYNKHIENIKKTLNKNNYDTGTIENRL